MEQSHTDRVVVLVDMDCFYCQVEEQLNPELKGKPLAVVQYNAWRGGGIIAVNYPARYKGVTRHMRGDEAKAKCPEIELVRVPLLRGKADLTKYREAGKKVAEVLQMFTKLLERASVDEAYMDITDVVCERMNQFKLSDSQLKSSFVVGFEINDFVEHIKELNDDDNLKLYVGSVIVEEIRAAVFERTGYTCSAGVAHNKILAKLACGLNKPNKQTILPHCKVQELYENLPIRKIRSLGGKFGETLTEDLGITTMGELIKFSERELIERYDEKSGSWLYSIARGIDVEPVTVRLVSKSIGCCKKFPGRTALKTFDSVNHWINELSEDICERLTEDAKENNRRATQLVVGFSQDVNRKDVHTSKSVALNSYEREKIALSVFTVINKHCMREDGSYCVKYLAMSAGKFEENRKSNTIQNYFSNALNFNCSNGGKGTVSIKKDSILNYFDCSVQKEKDSSTTSLLNGESLNVDYDRNNSTLKNTVNVSIDKKSIDKIGILDSSNKNTRQERNSVTTRLLDNHSNDISRKINNSTPNNVLDDYKVRTEKSITLNYSNGNNGEVENSLSTFDDRSVDSKDSIYLNDTIEIDDPEAATFNENCTTPDCDFISGDSNESDSESITREIISITTPKRDRASDGGSYFSNFFDNYVDTPRARNFNTSRNLEEEFISPASLKNDFNLPTRRENDFNSSSRCENDFNSPLGGKMYFKSSPGTTKELDLIPSELNGDDDGKTSSCVSPVIASTSHAVRSHQNQPIKSAGQLNPRQFESSSSNLKERCCECNKLIPVTEFLSHQDYHFALKMVREESSLYSNKNEKKTDNSNAPSKSTRNETKGTKRKKGAVDRQAKGVKRKKEPSDRGNKAVDQCNKLTAFFGKAKVDYDGPTETCAECNKKIPVDEFLAHLDYHAAKRLHLELNSDVGGNSGEQSSGVKKRGIASYFKQI